MVLRGKKAFKITKKAASGDHTLIHKTGWALLNDFAANKGQAFTLEERKSLGLQGLLPPQVLTIEEQQERVLIDLERLQDNLDKYIYLRELQDHNECLFYHCLMENVDLILPLVYTPVVGLACENYGTVHRRPRGLFISIEDKGQVEQVLRNWPHRDVRAIVVTDGARILGLGDLGANGMGIPVGKMAIYSAFGGIEPQHCLPVTLDVGTDNETFLKSDSNYIGLMKKRVSGEEYESFIDEFMTAVVKVFGRYTLVQFEDFASDNAFKFLDRYRQRNTMMNDDIQGTAAVALAGILAAGKFLDKDILKSTVLFVGAGQAGVGIAKLWVKAVGGDPEEARKRIYFKRSTKLVVKGDESTYDMKDERRFFCHEVPEGADIVNLVNIIKWMKPDILIGVSGTGGLFTSEVLRAMAEVTERPLIMPLSNPTDKSECTAEEAYTYTEGRCLFASGSPFPPLEVGGVLRSPQQCNNAYIFPGVALAATTARMASIPEDVFLIAAKALAFECVERDDFENGSLYPPLKSARHCSIQIATNIIQYAFDNNLAMVKQKPANIKDYILSQIYNPNYNDHHHHHHHHHH